MAIDRIMMMILRKMMSRGIKTGINRAANRGNPDPAQTQERASDTPDLSRQARDNSKRARQALRIGRRIGRL